MKRLIGCLVALSVLVPFIAYRAHAFGIIPANLAAIAAQVSQVRLAIQVEKTQGGSQANTMPKFTPLPTANGPTISSASTVVAASAALIPPPAAVAAAVANQTDAQRTAMSNDITSQIASIQKQVNDLSNTSPKPATYKVQLDALNDAISSKKQALAILQGGTTPVTASAVESFSAVANPYFIMCRDQFWAPNDTLGWKSKLLSIGGKLTNIGRSVGLVSFEDRPAGTGIVVGNKYIITNLHVLKLIATYDDVNKSWNVKDKAEITFDKETALGVAQNCATPNQPQSYFINLVVKVPKNGDDIAVLSTSGGANFPPAVHFDKIDNSAYQGNMVVAIIGYPGIPDDMTVPEIIEFFHTPIYANPQFAYKRVSEGYTGTDPVSGDGYFEHDANTAGGNSGSPVIDLSTGKVVGIHVMGVDRFRTSMGYNKALVSERVLALLSDAGV
ncbi:serine protease [Paraburkholderia aspalathi]|uniref:S1 family peptidase n=1 Tax=Paraburkholderia aspalathi TaxID=1324617 RepID=UPI001B0E56AD|nr:serine protease [Paraburkholderia aspalathi]CAE6708438.1 hypothetical protein R75465_00769 [Paraburkholderia aspalathi]